MAGPFPGVESFGLSDCLNQFCEEELQGWQEGRGARTSGSAGWLRSGVSMGRGRKSLEGESRAGSEKEWVARGREESIDKGMWPNDTNNLPRQKHKLRHASAPGKRVWQTLLLVPLPFGVLRALYQPSPRGTPNYQSKTVISTSRTVMA